MRLAASAHHVMMPSSSYLVRYYYRSICDTKVSLRGGIGQQQLKRENTNPFTVLLWMKDNHRGGSRTIHDPANHSTVPTTTLGMLLRWLDHRSLRVVVGQATTRTSRWNPHILMTVLVSKKKTWSNQPTNKKSTVGTNTAPTTLGLLLGWLDREFLRGPRSGLFCSSGVILLWARSSVLMVWSRRTRTALLQV